MNFKRDKLHNFYISFAIITACFAGLAFLIYPVFPKTPASPALLAHTGQTEYLLKTETESFPETTDETDTETSAGTESETSVETDLQVLSEPTETDSEYILAEPSVKDSSDMITEYAPGSPYADYKDSSCILETETLKISQMQPNYLADLTGISLSWEHLEEELISMTDSYSGNWAVYVKNLTNGESISVNSHPMESASLIKLYIMGAVMEQIHNGTLEETDTIDHLLNEMITVSDNEASNELVRYLSKDHDHEDGLTCVNSFAKRHGFEDTQQVNGLEDSRLRHNPSLINETSARDCGELLADIYDGTLVSHLASRKMEDLLLDQQSTYKIPAALPNNAVCANKTGEVSDAENDAAIIYSPGGDYILCIMSGKWSSGNEAISHIRDISRIVYNHFNPPEASQYEIFTASD